MCIYEVEEKEMGKKKKDEDEETYLPCS